MYVCISDEVYVGMRMYVCLLVHLLVNVCVDMFVYEIELRVCV